MNENEFYSQKEVTLKELFAIFLGWVRFLFSKLLIIISFSILGASLGYLYSYFQPINYIAKSTFILEEGKNSSQGFGGLASLAGQFGVEMGGDLNGGVLSGENILVYFKSPSLAREVLLSIYDSSMNQTIADRYAEVYKFNSVWEKNKNIGKIKFGSYQTNKKNIRQHDSLINVLSQNILSSQFVVNRTDKKSSFIDVTVSMQDELLAKVYCEKIVETVVNRYINGKIQRQKNTVDRLQSRADSLAIMLKSKTYSNLSLQNKTSTMDINPLYKTETNVAFETTARDKSMLATIFASVIQNLEMAKFTLNQETPVLQVIDDPILPLQKEKISKIKASLIASIGFFVIICSFLVFRRLFS